MGNLEFGEMEFGEMKRNTSNWDNFCMLLRRAGLSASAGLSCYCKKYILALMNTCRLSHFAWRSVGGPASRGQGKTSESHVRLS